MFPVDPATNPSPVPPGYVDDPEKRLAQRQLVLDVAQSSIQGLSKLIGLSDPKLAQQVGTVGGATVQVGQAVSKYLHDAETLKSASKGLAAAALTGDIIGAAVDMFSLFGSGPPDGGVLAQIKALSQQIEELHKDMDRRFDRVDASLNNILAQLSDNFAKIDFQLGVLNGNVQSIQAELLDIQARLNRLEQYSFAWLTAFSKEQLVEVMNGCLGYRARTGSDIGFAQFAVCENAFYTWAHDHSGDELWAGVQQPSYAVDDVYPTLVNFPLSANINYLAQFPAHSLQQPALTNARLANPNEWTLGARTSIQLGREWPKYASQINSSRISDVVQLGTSLRRAVQNVNRVSAGTVVSPNQPLLSALVGNYRSAANALQTAIEAFVTQRVLDPMFQGVKLWGGASQPVPSPLPGAPRVPAATRVLGWCDGTSIFSGRALPNDNMFIDRYFPTSDKGPFVMAEYFKLGTIDYCLDAWFENGTNKRNGSGVADVAIYGRFNGVRVIEWSKTP